MTGSLGRSYLRQGVLSAGGAIGGGEGDKLVFVFAKSVSLNRQLADHRVIAEHDRRGCLIGPLQGADATKAPILTSAITKHFDDRRAFEVTRESKIRQAALEVSRPVAQLLGIGDGARLGVAGRRRGGTQNEPRKQKDRKPIVHAQSSALS